MKFPRWAARAAVSAAGVLLALCAIEAGLRLYGAVLLEGAESGKSPANGPRILCLGDSWTFGVGAEPSESYPAHLRRLFKESSQDVSVVNGGIPGTNSSIVLRDLEKNIERIRPNLIIVMVGGNNRSNFEDNNFHLFLPRGRSWAARMERRFWKLKTYKLLRWVLGLRIGAEAPPPHAYRASAKERHSARSLEAEIKPLDVYRRLLSLRKSDQHDPQHERELGFLLIHRLDRPREAIPHLERAVALNPSDPDAWHQLSTAYHRVGELEKSLDAIERSPRRLAPKYRIVRRYGLPSFDEIEAHRKALAFDLEEIVGILKARGIKVVLMTYASDGWVSAVIAETALRLRVPLIDNRNLLERYSGVEGLFAGDGHFNGVGYRVLAESVRKSILDQIPLRTESPRPGPLR